MTQQKVPFTGNFAFPRGDKAKNDALIQAPGTMSIVTGAVKGLRIHDGVTPGGNPINVAASGLIAWATSVTGTLGTVAEKASVSYSCKAYSVLVGSTVTYSVVGGSLPSTMSITSTGLITGTAPDVAGNTNVAFTVRATDGTNSITKDFTLTVTGVNAVPSWVTAAGSLGTFTNVTLGVQLSATDPEGQTLTYTVAAGSLPTGLTLASNGLISGLNPADGATTTFTVAVSDGVNSVNRVFSMTCSPAVGEAVYTTPGTYQWVCPAGVTSVCVVGIGAGGGYDVLSNGGAGGGLAYANNRTVTPGHSYTVVIGDGAQQGVRSVAGTTSFVGDDLNLSITGAQIINGGNQPGVGFARNLQNTKVGEEYRGGYGGAAVQGLAPGGGGGAAGYAGNGGDGGRGGQNGHSAPAGSGAGGGAYGMSGAQGGSVGLYGIGADGAGGTYPSPSHPHGYGGSGGVDGDSGGPGNGGMIGGNGAIRIMWGAGRSFPSNAGAVSTLTTEAVYTSPGNYNWVCPVGVTSVCLVAVGAGGNSGGGLMWANNIPVVPGTSYPVSVGISYTSGNSQVSGNASSVTINTFVYNANGGQGTGTGATLGGTFGIAPSGISCGGGRGGASNNGAGGGAGGYNGTGGSGFADGYGSPGTGGGGGGAGAGGGGGVGLYGQGSDGAAGNFGPGGGGSGGTRGGGNSVEGFHGGLFGGGGASGNSGGNGAVRIIWASGKSFPNNAA